MEIRSLLVLCILLFLFFAGYGQQNCSGFNEEYCYVTDSFEKNDFQIEKKWESVAQVNSASTPLSIDVDGDCMPELIIKSASNVQIIILDGNNGTLKSLIETEGFSSMVVADIDRDGQVEFIVAIYNFAAVDPIYRGKLICYNIDGSIKWISDTKYDDDLSGPAPQSLGVADFNKDGISEIYVFAEIYNGLNGKKLVEGNHGKGFNIANGISIAAELDGDNTSLELAAGYTIYQVQINNTNGLTGNSMLPNNVEVNGTFIDGYTTVSDLNNNGTLEVIVSTSNNVSDPTIYVYELVDGIAEITYFMEYPHSSSSTRLGIPTIFRQSASQDSVYLIFAIENSLECSTISATGGIERKWSYPTLDGGTSSGVVAFDINADGVHEIIYRDENQLHVIANIITNNPIGTSLICGSVTNFEKPIVVSLDSTLQAQICVTCYDEIGNQRLTVFGPPEGSHWAPARGIWNQYNYHVLNINDDGTVPQFQENNATYQDGRYNNFMVQASLLDEDGNMLTPAANLVGEMQCVEYDIETNTYTVTFDIYNLEDASQDAESGMSVSFYDGDPTSTGVLLATYQTTQSIASNASLIGLTFSFSVATIAQLFMVVNSEGITPVPILDEDYDILECDYTDNISQILNFPVFTEITATICDGSTYDFYGDILSTVGTYNYTVDNEEGCDSLLVELMLVEDCEVEECEPIDTSLCYVEQTGEFGFTQVWESEDEVNNRLTNLMADINGDCIPEIIALSRFNNEILFIDIKTGLTVHSFDVYRSTSQMSVGAVADVDNDGEIEIFIATGFSNVQQDLVNRIVCYELDGSIKWVSDKPYIEGLTSSQINRSATLGLADFNRDGISEVYTMNSIFNAETGVRLAHGPNRGVGYSDRFRGSSMAADLDNNADDLELASGYTIYQVDIVNVASEVGNEITAIDIRVNSRFIDGETSIADINQDGKLDVIVTGEDNDYFIYAYTLEGETSSLIFSEVTPNALARRLFISDVDNDGKMNIVFGHYVINIYEFQDGNLVLENEINTGVWNTVGMVYDFQNDTLPEMIFYNGDVLIGVTDFPDYNFVSEQSLGYSVYPGHFNIANSNGISNPYVIVGGKVGDKETLIGLKPSEFSSNWNPSRSIRNQYNYNVLNINDDGTVPQFQENNATYQDGRYNNFMVQSSTLDEDGNMLTPAASLMGEMKCVAYDFETDLYTITFDIHNLEDASLDAESGVNIMFYNGDPTSTGVLIGAYTINEVIEKNTSLLGLQLSLSLSGITQLFMVVNSNDVIVGQFDEEDYNILECDYSDNISQYISFPSIDEIMGSVCDGSAYDFYGTSISLPGTYYQTVNNQYGCDSLLAELILEVRDTILVALDLTVCDTFIFAQDTLLTSGDYQYEGVSVNGCDSITQLTLTVLSSSGSVSSMVSCDSLVWNGVTYDSTDTYFYLISNAAGCDSTAVLELTVNRSDSVAFQVKSCESYDWNGTNYSESGIYYHTEDNAMGCDSVTVIDLEIDDVLTEMETIESCDSLLWNGVMYTASGSYSHDTISINDCDSIVMLDLEIFSNTEMDTMAMICDSFYWRGEMYYESGSYTSLEQSIYGCDSTTVLQLDIIQSSTTVTEITQCEIYEWNDEVYTESGDYQFESVNVNGCDSIATLQLTLLAVSNEEIDLQICDSLLWHDELYTETGIYTFDTLNMAGCDSTVMLNLEIAISQEVMIDMSVCDSLIYQGDTLVADGVYYFDLINAAGCDSSIVLDLSITSDYMQESMTHCGSLVWEINGETYIESGIYYHSFTNVSDCDSIYELNLTIHPSYESVEVIDVCGAYLWPVTDELLTSSGTYTDENVTAQGCDSISVLDLVIHPIYELHDTVSSVNEYYWEVDNMNYTQSGIYEYDLSTNQDCDSIHVLHLFLDFNTGIHTPNIISNSDVNNYFTVYGDQTISVIKKLYVFDRWGSLVAERSNIAPSQPSLGWDGTFNGQNVVPGVYIWMAELELLDGSMLTVYGDVSVIR